MQRTSLILFIK